MKISINVNKLSCALLQTVLYFDHIMYDKGWEPMFIMGAFGLFKELSTKVGFAFSSNCLKSQDLQFGIKKINCLFDNVL